MANEINVTAVLNYANSAVGIAQKTLSIAGVNFSITGSNYVLNRMLVPTTAGGTLIPLSNLATLGLFLIINHDAANYVDILTAVNGTAILRLQPGEAAMGRFSLGITVPAALAHTAICGIEFLFLES